MKEFGPVPELPSAAQTRRHGAVEVAGKEGLGMFGGLDVVVVPTWVHGWAFVKLWKFKRPTKADGRKGTKRDWKRAHGVGLRWSYVPVEPDHVLRMGGKIICTARQLAALSDGAAQQHPTGGAS